MNTIEQTEKQIDTLEGLKSRYLDNLLKAISKNIIEDIDEHIIDIKRVCSSIYKLQGKIEQLEYEEKKEALRALQ